MLGTTTKCTTHGVNRHQFPIYMDGQLIYQKKHWQFFLALQKLRLYKLIANPATTHWVLYQNDTEQKTVFRVASRETEGQSNCMEFHTPKALAFTFGENPTGVRTTHLH